MLDITTVNTPRWQNGKLAKWQVGKMANWQNGKWAKWQVGKMASWQNGRLAKWQVGKMASWQNDLAPVNALSLLLGHHLID
jgi:hypothetical protein